MSSYLAKLPGQLNLAIPPWVGMGKMHTGDAYGHCQGRNGKFCITVGPVKKTTGMQTQSAKGVNRADQIR